MKETREQNMSYGLTGNKYKSRTTRMTIPVPWADELGFTPEDRKAKITLDNDKIIIEKAKD